jgi:hypothetical protein
VAASLTSGPIIECAPGNIVVLAGADLTGATQVVLGNQLIVYSDGTAPVWTGTVAIPCTVNEEGASATFVVPDKVRSGVLTITAGDDTSASVSLRVVSQYVQASEYAGGTEGVDTSQLAPGVLDQVLREASAYADSWCGAGSKNIDGFRVLQSVEDHKFKPRKSGPPRFWIWRPRNFVSVDELVFITSNQIRTAFDVSLTTSSDIYVNVDLGYWEMLAYAFGNYVLLGMIETIGFSANVVQCGYTAGYYYRDYPAPIRKATSIIATELLTYARIQAGGMGGFSSVKHGLQQYDRRDETFAIPAPAKDLLRPFLTRRLA